MVAAVMFGLTPALQSTRPSLVQTTRGNFDTPQKSWRLRGALVIGQVTLSVVLLIAAGLLLATAKRAQRTDPGIRTADVIQVELPPRFASRALDILRREPIVRSIAGASATALDGLFPQVNIAAEGDRSRRVYYNVVTPTWFSVLDLPILRGRTFTEEEARSRVPVAIVSASMARTFWGDRDPIGQTLVIPATDRDARFLASYRSSRVIAVAQDAIPGAIIVPASSPVVYFPQTVEASAHRLLVRTTGDVGRAQIRLDSALAAIDSGAIQEMHSLDQALALQVYPWRAMHWVASALGALALALTLIGVYGVMSYMIAQRRKEMGIRLALGAAESSLIILVLRQSMRLSAAGLVAGSVLALGVSALMRSVLVNAAAYDLVGYGGAIALVAVSCLFAAYLPARRAAVVNPVETLRADS
jgi:predicted permease